jgi:RNA ligase
MMKTKIEQINSINDIVTLLQIGFTNWRQYGNVNVLKHPEYDYWLFNYTAEAQFRNNWNWFELNSRGLIISPTGEVIARPFDKFFNWFENGRTNAPRTYITEITEKMDGSLIILYRTPEGKFSCATRGSFTSPQAVWATEFIKKYNLSELPDELTLLFEGIYPSNRIVVDYEGREDLVLIGARNRHTGEYLPLFPKRKYEGEPNRYEIAQQFGFTLPRVYTFNDVNTLLEEAARLTENEEGWVVRFSDDTFFKFKGDRYRELHRLVSGLSPKKVLEAAQNGIYDQYKMRMPEEFWPQMDEWFTIIDTEYRRCAKVVVDMYEEHNCDDRKEFARRLFSDVRGNDVIRACLFNLHDGKEHENVIWKRTDWKKFFSQSWEKKQDDET